MNETLATFDQFQQHHTASRDALARATWSTMIQSGDQDAGELIANLNAADALTAALIGETVLRTLRESVIHKCPLGVVERTFRSAARLGVELLTPEHPHWPTHMNPVALWVRGTQNYSPVISPVGSLRYSSWRY